MSCDKYSEYSILYAYDELSNEDRKNYENHLALCSDCRAEVESFKRVHSLYREAPNELPDFSLSLLLRTKIGVYAWLLLIRNKLKEFFFIGRKWAPSSVAATAVIILCFLAVTHWDFERKINKPLGLYRLTITDFDIMLDNIDFDISNIFTEKNVSIDKYLNSERKSSVSFGEFFDDLESIHLDVEILSWGMEKKYF